ncbi:MAG: cell wall hydrolase [Clostridia bacterium]
MTALVAILVPSAQAAGAWTERQQTAHQIAELARSLELAEDDPIIIRAKELWAADVQEFTADEIEMIATTMYYEAGNGCTEEHQLLVGRVLLNRVADGRFGGSTVYDCLVAPRQYSLAYTGALKIPKDRREEMMALARRAAAGEPTDCPRDVLYQDNLPHGTGVYKSIYSELLGSTTYFCYG